MTKQTYRPGDVFLIDSDSTSAKIVKFFMMSPSVWHYLAGKIYEFFTKKEAPQHLIKKSDYFHVGMVLDEENTIEQYGKVITRPITRLEGRTRLVFRRKNLREKQRKALIELAKSELGLQYDWALIFGKFITWLTGIPLFSYIVNAPHKELCVTRVAKWYYKILEEEWGCTSWHVVTTTDMEYYVKKYPERYKIIEETND